MSTRIGLVGAGTCAERLAHAAAELAEVELVAVAAPFAADEFASRHAIPFAFKDYRSLIEGVPVDVVIVAAPTDVHYDVCIAAADAGLRVLCPSPLASGPGEADLLAELVGRRALLLSMIAPELCALEAVFGGRFPPSFRWLRRAKRPQGWRLDPDRAGGGVLMDLGASALLALQALKRAPVRVEAAAITANEAVEWGPVDIAARVHVRVGSGEVELDLAWWDGEPLDQLTVPGSGPLALRLGASAWLMALRDALLRHVPSFEDGLGALQSVFDAYFAATEGRAGESPPEAERAIDYWLAGGWAQRSGR